MGSRWDPISGFYEGDIPYRAKTLRFIALGKKLEFLLPIHGHAAYADTYQFNAAIEKAGGTDDIGKLIKAMEAGESVYSQGKMKYETRRIKPFFHSRGLCDSPNSYMYSGTYLLAIAQFHKNGKIAYLEDEKGKVHPRITSLPRN